MKSAYFLLLYLTFSVPAYAYDDICAVASPLMRSTTTQIEEFSSKHVAQHTFEGSGRVRDVRRGVMGLGYTVYVDCGKSVLVEVPSSSPRASVNLKNGESVSFSGTASGMYRKLSSDRRSTYLLVVLNVNSSVW